MIDLGPLGPLGIVALAAVATVGFFWWTLFEYLLHRFAMHNLGGRGIMSREHLEHHVTHTWYLAWTHPLSWAGMLLVGFAAWLPLVAAIVGVGFGIAFAIGWSAGYGFYEVHHARAHLRAPMGRYGAMLRRHHFHHHFGHPMANHAVTMPFWDHLFGTHQRPERVRVPRRFAMGWLTDSNGELHKAFADDYVLVGTVDNGERQAKLDRARAFSSLAPAD